MATYAAYRHIELDKVGYSKKRVRNPPSDIFKVLSTSAPSSPTTCSPNRSINNSRNNDSFNRLFGTPEPGTPRRSSLTKQDINRNPVTGNGVDSFDSRPIRNTPRQQRNPVTGEIYIITTPVTTPTAKPICNGHAINGTA